MPDAHEAAVEAMAGALAHTSLAYPDGSCDDADHWSDPPVLDAARKALVGLVRSEAVRAALVEALHEAHHSHDLDCLWHRNVACAVRNDAERDADAILAALAPEATCKRFQEHRSEATPVLCNVLGHPTGEHFCSPRRGTWEGP